MARKSRKYQNQTDRTADSALSAADVSAKSSGGAEFPVPELGNSEAFGSDCPLFAVPTAAYVRLSNENGSRDDADTIEMQLTLVMDFITSRPELEYADAYIDNGYSGTNFERPAFLSMLGDIRQGRIKCVVVKDLSRFGRNYLETGYYVETVFPFLGVRLIAVTDHFDSSRREDVQGLTVPIRNLVNDLYARDISKKIWSANQQLKRQGRSCGSCAPYGYIRDKSTGKNEIDWKTAHFVQMIFQWALLGCTTGEIARRLDLLGAPTPRERAHELGFARETNGAVWNASTLYGILKNRTYIGDTVTNKTSQAYFAGQKKTVLPENEWVITKGTHEPLIAEDDYEALQEIFRKKAKITMARRAEALPSNEEDMLSGMVYCADCGKKMRFDRIPHKRLTKHRTACYVCKGVGSHTTCRGHSVTAAFLKKAVMENVKEYIRNFCDRERLLETMMGKSGLALAKEAGQAAANLIKQEQELAEKNRKLYEDFAMGILSADEYEYLRKKYSRQRGQIRQRLAEAREEMDRLNRDWKKYGDRADKWRDFLSDNSTLLFDEHIVRETVEKIRVRADGRIELEFKFADLFGKFAEPEGQEKVL